MTTHPSSLPLDPSWQGCRRKIATRPLPDGRFLAVVTEIRHDPGLSPKRCIALCAQQLCHELTVTPDRLVLVEQLGSDYVQVAIPPALLHKNLRCLDIRDLDQVRWRRLAEKDRIEWIDNGFDDRLWTLQPSFPSQDPMRKSLAAICGLPKLT